METETRRRRGYRMVARAEATAATRERILDSATQLFLSLASDGFSLEDVAEGAGTTVQTVLRHFGSKELLLRAGIDRASERISRERMLAPIGDVRGAVANVVEHYEAHGDTAMRLLNEDRNPVLREVVDRGRAFHREWVTHTFAPQLRPLRGAVRRRRLAQLVAVTDVYVWKLLRRDMQLSREQTQEAMVELIERLEND
jgi:AcrR family transcriptional regulator